MNILVTEGIRNAARWDKALGALLQVEDPIARIVNTAPRDPRAASKHLKRIARGASSAVLWELTRREYGKNNHGDSVNRILSKYKATKFEGIRGMGPTKLRIGLRNLIIKINIERQKLGTRCNVLGFHGVSVDGAWVEITDFNDALEVFKEMNKAKM